MTASYLRAQGSLAKHAYICQAVLANNPPCVAPAAPCNSVRVETDSFLFLGAAQPSAGHFENSVRSITLAFLAHRPLQRCTIKLQSLQPLLLSSTRRHVSLLTHTARCCSRYNPSVTMQALHAAAMYRGCLGSLSAVDLVQAAAGLSCSSRMVGGGHWPNAAYSNCGSKVGPGRMQLSATRLTTTCSSGCHLTMVLVCICSGHHQAPAKGRAKR